MFLPLPLAIWLSLVLAGLAVSDCGLSLLQACVSVLLGDQFSPEGIWLWRAMAQGQLWGADRNQKDLPMAVLPILCPEGSGQVPPVLPALTGMSALQCYPHYPCGI